MSNNEISGTCIFVKKRVLFTRGSRSYYARNMPQKSFPGCSEHEGHSFRKRIRMMLTRKELSVFPEENTKSLNVISSINIYLSQKTRILRRFVITPS